MKTKVAVLAVAAMLAVTGPVLAESEAWSEIPTASLPMTAGPWRFDPGGDSMPSFTPGSSAYDTVASAPQVEIVADGDRYDVIARASAEQRGKRFAVAGTPPEAGRR